MSEEIFQILLFALIFLFLPAIEGMLRRRKQQGGSPMPDAEWEEPEWEEPAWEEPEEPHSQSVPEPGTSGRDHPTRSSEDLLPADLWEELRALARGERARERLPDAESESEARDPHEEASGQRASSPSEVDRPEWTERASGTLAGDLGTAPLPRERTARSRLPRDLPPRPRRRVPAEAGQPEREERPSHEATPRTRLGDFPEAELAPIGSEPARPGEARRVSPPPTVALLGELRAMRGTDLRRAVIFREVLGPPVAERDD